MPAYNMDIRVTAGFPDAGSLAGIAEIDDIVDSDGFDVTAPNGASTRWALPNTTNCYVQYIQPSPGDRFPGISTVASGC